MPNLNSRFPLLLFATLFSFSTITAQTNWQQKVSPALLSMATPGNDNLPFIIVLNQQADISEAPAFTTKEQRGQYVFSQLREAAEASQTNILQLLQSQNKSYQSFYVINAIKTTGDYNLIQQLATRTDVQKIIDNGLFKIEKPVEQFSDNLLDPEDIEWGIAMINADDVWAMGITGEGVVVGGQDTGYEWEHPALQSKYRGWDSTGVDHNYNWHDAIHEINPLHGDSIIDPSNNPCGLDVPFPCDDHNHGTHTMGTMVGSEGTNEIGVAPDAKWIACRNMERGYGSPATYIECFEWLMAPTDLNNENPDPTKSPHVFANSWSCPEVEGCDSTNWSVMEMVVNNVKASGIVVVVSAGNSGSQGCGSVSTPAAMFENSFTVGATRQNDTIVGFSSRGPVLVDNSGRMKPDVSAPGRQVRSSIRNGAYASFSGTSMAGPHVAGLVALMISANPQLAGQVEVIEEIVKQTAVPKTIDDEECGGIPGTEVPNNTYGFGRVDALAAVEEALLFTPVKNVQNQTSVRAFPNPFQEEVVFSFENFTGETALQIYNASGQLVHSFHWDILPNERKNISLNGFSDGIYFYQITNGSQQFSGKVMKQ